MKVINKQARFKYNLFDRYEAGIALSGYEVKAVRGGSIDLSHAYVRILENQVYLINAQITGKTMPTNYNPTRMRKLLLHKKEIISIATKIKAKKLTLVPTKMYNKGHLFKIEIALGKTKKQFQKKEAKKRADLDREAERELRGDKDRI